MSRTNKSFLSPVLSDSQRQVIKSPFSPQVENSAVRPFKRQVNDPLTDNISKVSAVRRNDPDLQEYLKTLSRKSSDIKKVEVNNLSDISISDEDSDILNTKMIIPPSRFLKKSESKVDGRNKIINPSLQISNSPEVNTRQSNLNVQGKESSEESLSYLLNEEISLSEEIQSTKNKFLKKPPEVDSFVKLRKNDSEMLKSDSHLRTSSVQYNKTSAALNKVALFSQKYLRKPDKTNNLLDAKEIHITSENESNTQSFRSLESGSSRDLNFEKQLIKELTKVDVSKKKTKLATIKKDSDNYIPDFTFKPEVKKQTESEGEMVIETTFEAQSDTSDSLDNLLDLDQMELADVIDKNVNLYLSSTESYSEDLKHVDRDMSKEPSPIRTEKSVSSQNASDDYSEEFEEANEFREISEDSKNAGSIASLSGSQTKEFIPSLDINEGVESRQSFSEENVDSFKSLAESENSLSLINQEKEEPVISSQKEVVSLPLFNQKDIKDSLPFQSHKVVESLPSNDHKVVKSLSPQDHKDMESLPSNSDKGELLSVSDLKYRTITIDSSNASHKSCLSSQKISRSEGSLDSFTVSKKVSKKRNFERYLKRKAAVIKKVDAAVQASTSFSVPEVVYFATPKPIAVNLEAWTSTNPEMLALTDLLCQQLELTKNFSVRQESLYQTWSGNLNSNYHYTTLRETKEMIRRHRKEGKKTSKKSELILL